MSIAMMVVGTTHFISGVLPLFPFRLADQEWLEYSQYLNITPAEQASDFLSILLGIVLVILGIGLYHRRRNAWYWAEFILFVALINSVYGEFVPQTFYITLAYFFLLLIFRKEYSVGASQHMDYPQAIAWLSVLFALLYGVVGSYLLREQFSHIKSWSDAMYFTVVTYSTVGYGDIVPTSPNAKLFVTSMIVVGVSSFVAALSVLIGPILEKRIKGVLRMVNRLKNLKNHIIICGENPMSLYAASMLISKGHTCLFLVDSPDQAQMLEQKGLLAWMADSTEQSTLLKANLAKAEALICAYDNDAQNILTLITATYLRDQEKHSSVKIICRIDEKQNVSKAKRLGANEVISPAIIGGDMMAKRAVSDG